LLVSAVCHCHMSHSWLGLDLGWFHLRAPCPGANPSQLPLSKATFWQSDQLETWLELPRFRRHRSCASLRWLAALCRCWYVSAVCFRSNRPIPVSIESILLAVEKFIRTALSFLLDLGDPRHVAKSPRGRIRINRKWLIVMVQVSPAGTLKFPNGHGKVLISSVWILVALKRVPLLTTMVLHH
jgi:hypothetical protein